MGNKQRDLAVMLLKIDQICLAIFCYLLTISVKLFSILAIGFRGEYMAHKYKLAAMMHGEITHLYSLVWTKFHLRFPSLCFG